MCGCLWVVCCVFVLVVCRRFPSFSQFSCSSSSLRCCLVWRVWRLLLSSPPASSGPNVPCPPSLCRVVLCRWGGARVGVRDGGGTCSCATCVPEAGRGRRVGVGGEGGASTHTQQQVWGGEHVGCGGFGFPNTGLSKLREGKENHARGRCGTRGRRGECASEAQDKACVRRGVCAPTCLLCGSKVGEFVFPTEPPVLGDLCCQQLRGSCALCCASISVGVGPCVCQ